MIKRALSWWWAVLGFTLPFVWVSVQNAPIVHLRITEAFYDLDILNHQLTAFKASTGKYPDTGPGWTDQFQFQIRPKDPWGHVYVYRLHAGKDAYELYSSGANGIDEQGAGDDVTGKDKHYDCATYGYDCPPDISTVAVLVASCLAVFSLLVGIWRGAMVLWRRLQP